MFDVLALFVPSVRTAGRLRAVRRETAWGASDEVTFYWGDVPFARAVQREDAAQAAARSACPPAWAGLTLAREAWEAARAGDGAWARYLDALRAVLDAHPEWVLWVEADCEQYPVVAVELSAGEVVERLDAQRRAPRSDFAWRITPAAGRTR